MNQTASERQSLSRTSGAAGWKSSLGRVLNIFAAPGDVLDEVLAAPVDLVNWRLPTLLVCFSTLVCLPFRLPNDLTSSGWPLAASMVAIAAAVGGSLWSAMVLWLIGRFCLQSRFSFFKTLEAVGLITSMVALGNVVEALLMAATGKLDAHASALLLFSSIPKGSMAHQLLALLNVFHLWTIALLALALSKLTSVTFKEAAFWVFGYWLGGRLMLLLLA